MRRSAAPRHARTATLIKFRQGAGSTRLALRFMLTHLRAASGKAIGSSSIDEYIGKLADVNGCGASRCLLHHAGL